MTFLVKIVVRLSTAVKCEHVLDKFSVTFTNTVHQCRLPWHSTSVHLVFTINLKVCDEG